MEGFCCSGSERRHFLRIDENVGVRYMRLEENLAQLYETETKSKTENIGGGGLRFLTAEPIAPKTLLEIEFRLPGLVCPLVAIGKVLRVSERLKDSEYEIAVSFVWVRKEDRQRIEAYIKQKAD